MSNVNKEINYLLESCCSGIIKKISGKGPERTRVDIKGNYVTIEIRGILSEIEKAVLNHENNYKRVEYFRQGLVPILTEEILKQVCIILCKELIIISDEENILDNSKVIVLKII
ncbi:hypothetical protein GCM10008905_23660 [Clostridium malenominatum]|uniref:Na+-translocating membrane potential-generating system MpsC domain-containing protein n=1 Tax=Clostridium malenominatum TaxID=1539 RepID=A0ABP3UAL5_9CLOT